MTEDGRPMFMRKRRCETSGCDALSEWRWSVWTFVWRFRRKIPLCREHGRNLAVHLRGWLESWPRSLGRAFLPSLRGASGESGSEAVFPMLRRFEVTSNSNTGDGANLEWSFSTTLPPSPVNVSHIEDDVWNFDFSVAGLTEEAAGRLAERIMLVLCGGGWFRHTRLGAWLLNCRRVVVGSFRPR